MRQNKHIGIVAVSSPGAALCFQTICVEAERLIGKRYAHPEVSMHAFPFDQYMQLIENGEWDGLAELLAASSRKLAEIGADFAICPDNTAHIAFEKAVKMSPIPWLHIAEEVAGEAERLGLKRIAILGTRFLMESKVYPSKLERYGISWVIPNGEQREIINGIIFNELVYGVIKEESREKLVRIIEGLAEKDGCDAVVLGCTELPLILDEKTSPIPPLDSTRILARAALREAVSSRQ
ncbi:amino acid racemase [Candidatus Bathyarchaeota archaeon]|nr:amino acid racemase [Candidatus Bathyarchaeota archaeon]